MNFGHVWADPHCVNCEKHFGGPKMEPNLKKKKPKKNVGHVWPRPGEATGAIKDCKSVLAASRAVRNWMTIMPSRLSRIPSDWKQRIAKNRRRMLPVSLFAIQYLFVSKVGPFPRRHLAEKTGAKRTCFCGVLVRARDFHPKTEECSKLDLPPGV